MGNFLIIFGVLIVVLGIILNLLGKYGFPHLPGDILNQKGSFTFYFPIVTTIVISIILTVVINLFK